VWLTSRLALPPPGDICGFQTLLSASRGRVNTFLHWHAAYVLCDGLCSADRLFEFQSWLIGLGREVLASVAASPDALADVPAVRTLLAVGAQSWPDAAWPLWEGLSGVAREAFFVVTGRSLDNALAILGRVPVDGRGAVHRRGVGPGLAGGGGGAAAPAVGAVRRVGGSGVSPARQHLHGL
jgi:hypothetical protein